MASVTALAFRTGTAQERIDRAAAEIAAVCGIAAISKPNHKDQAVRIMLQLEAVARFLEAVKDALQAEKAEAESVKQGKREAI